MHQKYSIEFLDCSLFQALQGGLDTLGEHKCKDWKQAKSEGRSRLAVSNGSPGNSIEDEEQSLL